MKILNLTPHSIEIARKEEFVNLVDGRGHVMTADSVEAYTASIKSSGVARSSTETNFVGEEDGIKVFKTVFGGVEGLPDDADDYRYIVVSLPTKAAAVKNDHPLAYKMVTPYGVVRDSSNTSRVLACLGLTY